MLAPKFLSDVLWPYIHGDQAVIRAPELLANAAEQIARIAGLHAR